VAEKAHEFSKKTHASVIKFEDIFEYEIVSLATSGSEAGWFKFPNKDSGPVKMLINTSLRDIGPATFRYFTTTVIDDLKIADQAGTPFHDALGYGGYVYDVKMLCHVGEGEKFDKVIVNPMG